MLQLIAHLNSRFEAASCWEHVPLERCFVALGMSESLFRPDLPAVWKALGLPSDSGDSIVVFSSNPRGERGFYRLPVMPDGQGLFQEMPDPGEGWSTALDALVRTTSKLADSENDLLQDGDWTICRATRFLETKVENAAFEEIA
jgi:hypothetical protein